MYSQIFRKKNKKKYEEAKYYPYIIFMLLYREEEKKNNRVTKYMRKNWKSSTLLFIFGVEMPN